MLARPRGPNDARWTTWCKICEAWKIDPVPLSTDVSEKVGASLRKGGYRSSAQYFSRARKEHVQVTGMPVPAPVEIAIRDAIRSIERGMGNNAPKDAFRLDALDIGTDLLGARLAWLHAMVVISRDRVVRSSRQTTWCWTRRTSRSALRCRRARPIRWDPWCSADTRAIVARSPRRSAPPCGASHR